MVARIGNDYRPQLPVVEKDIPGPTVLCHVGTARLLETLNNRTRSVRRAVRVLIQIRMSKITTCYMQKNMTVQYNMYGMID